MTFRIGFLVSHPIQYFTPLFRELDERCDLSVYFAHRQSPEQQAEAGYGVPFDWDIDLLSGYRSEFLPNLAKHPSPSTFWGCNTPMVASRITSGNFDAFIVPGWALFCYWQATFACWRNKVPILVRGDSQLNTQRHGLTRLVKEGVFRQVLRGFDGFLYVGQRNREYLLHYGVLAQRLFFSPHCVDNDAFRKASAAGREERARAPSDRVARILFVGRLSPNKNPLDVLKAAALLKKRGRAVEVIVAGAGQLGDRLKEYASSEGVAVQFCGFVNQSELPAVYGGADVLVLPSTHETWGLVVNEGMACGLPAVVSDAVGCGPDLIERGITGAVFRCGDVAALAQGIEQVLSGDPAAVRRAVAERVNRYSPAAAADGILDAVARIREQASVRST
jgi:glycosyltransferase involved in cell wall biosynthesis